MEHLYSLGCAIAGVVFLILAYVLYRNDVVEKNQTDCNDQTKWSKDSCTVWTNNTCYKAKITDNGTTCTKSSDLKPVIIGSLGVIALIAGSVLYFYYDK